MTTAKQSSRGLYLDVYKTSNCDLFLEVLQAVYFGLHIDVYMTSIRDVIKWSRLKPILDVDIRSRTDGPHIDVYTTSI